MNEAEVDPERGRSRPRHRTLLVLLVPLAAIVAAAGIGYVIWSRDRGQGPHPPTDSPAPETPVVVIPPGSDGPDWSYQQLLEHLQARGLTVKMAPSRFGQLYMLTDGDNWATGAAGLLEHGPHWIHPDAVACEKHPTAEAAKAAADEYARRTKNEQDTFAWGRFTFIGNRFGHTTLAKFQKALTGRSDHPADGPPDRWQDRPDELPKAKQ